MDPLSVTASIIAVIQISGAVVSICYEYRSAVKGALKAATRVTEEVKGLQDVLERLLRLAEVETARGSSSLPTLQPLLEPGGALDRCQEDLSALRCRLSPARLEKPLFRALKWPLTESDVMRTVDQLSRVKGTISLALITDQTAISLGIKDTVETIAATQRNFILDDTQLKLHHWLKPPDPSTNHTSARRLSHAGTGSWLIQDKRYTAWKSGSATSLWLHGIPGAGKTIICSTIIEDLIRYCQLKATDVLAFYYFDFNDAEKQSYANALRSIVAQISAQYHETPKALCRLYNTSGAGLKLPDNVALLRALRPMLEPLGQCYIVLDALDEAQHRDEVLGLVREILSWKLPNVHLLITSRRELDIDTVLSALVGCEICMRNVSIDADISAFVHDNLEHDRRLKQWPPSVKTEIESTLRDGAAGMFRWAVCQLDLLRKCVKLPALQATLRSLPRTLDKTYSRILVSIDEEYAEDAIRVLKWLAFSARPLQLEEVVEILAIDWKSDGKPNVNLDFRLPDPRDILTICSSLISLEGGLHNSRASSQPGVTFVRLAHSSVKDYLISGRIRQSPAAPYALHGTASHAFITQCCMVYLLQFTAPPDTVLHQAFPLTQYSIRYWTYHFKMSDITKDDESVDLAIELLTSDRVPYTSWCRIYDPDRPWLDAADLVLLNCDVRPLYYMSLLGLGEVCQRLVDAGANPNTVGGLFWSPLQAAAKQGHRGVVELLLKAGGKTDNQESGGEPALVLAAADGHESVVQSLLANGADVNIRSTVSATALGYAAQNGHEKTVQLLLDAGADPEQWSRRLQQSIPLVEAASNGYDKIVLQLLPSASHFAIEQALVSAASRERESIIEILLRRGIAPHNTLLYAAGQGHTAALEVHDAEEHRREYGYRSALYSAISANRPEVVSWLLQRGANLKDTVKINHNKISGIPNPLLHATTKRRLPIVKILLDYGADPNGYSDYGNSPELPLRIAAAHGDIEIMKILLDHGADINAQTEDSYSAVHSAARGGHHEALRLLLLERHANPHLALGNGSLALHTAACHGHPKCIEVCLEAGLDINACNGSGKTVLHWALYRAYHYVGKEGQQATVELLLAKGVDIGIREKETGMTALDYALRSAYDQPENKHHQNMVDLLKAYSS